ncbi:hypothetical protein B0H34DRAFT_308731 [Crassisporium funariophilum]|nr:hypothetical protein B0H34DRAFT_308731 [Crassisporium funariophilum]
MNSREDLPRVSIGNAQEWQTLRSNYREAALARLQSQIIANGLSREKDALIAHMDQFIERTFTIAQPNLRVNGQNFESLDENGREMEAFDETLDRRIWSLADTRLQWHKRIAETRRAIPTEIESTVSTLLERHGELDSKILPPMPIHAADEELSPEEDDIRQRRIEQALLKTSATVNELNQTISREQERGDRVKVVAVEVKSLKQ